MLLKISRFWEEIRYLIKLHWSPQGWQWKRIPRSGLVGSLRDPSCSQSCPTLWDPVDYSSPGSSVHGDSPGKILKRVARPSSRGFTQPRDRTQVSHIAGRHLNLWATREAPSLQECKSNLYWWITSHLSVRQSSQILKTVSAGVGLEKGNSPQCLWKCKLLTATVENSMEFP